MKMRKLTAFIVAVVALVATFNLIPAKTVKAAPADPEFVQTYEYTNSYIASKFLNEEQLKDTAYRFVYAKDGDVLPTDKKDFKEIKSGKTTFYNAVDKTYSIHFFKVDDKGDAVVGNEVDGHFKLITKESIDNTSISFKAIDVNEYKKYFVAIDEKINGTKDADGNVKTAGKEINDYFYYSSIKDYVSSLYFDYEDLDITLYYSKPHSTSFTKTSSSSFQLSEIGNYSFFFTAKDDLGNTNDFDYAKKVNVADKDEDMYVRKAVAGLDVEGCTLEAWYQIYDEDGNKVNGSEGNFVAPIFSFYFGNVSDPKIEIKKSEDGYKGLTYKDGRSSIIVTADHATEKYTLYYSDKALTTEGDWNVNGVKYLEENNGSNGVEDITDREEAKFNSSSLEFTPDRNGYYYIVCNVADSHGGTAARVTNAISVTKGFESVNYESEFLKYNWVSIVFLSIAGLSLIGIIVLFFIKPKDTKAEEEVNKITKK